MVTGLLLLIVVLQVLPYLVPVYHRWTAPPPVPPPPPPDRSPLLQAASALNLEAEQRFGEGFGEAKRHFVYAALVKQFPGMAKRTISLAIEEALT